MKVNIKKSIFEKMDEAIAEAKKNGKVIESFELSESEYFEIAATAYFAIPVAPNKRIHEVFEELNVPDEYKGIKIIRIEG